MNVSVAPTRRAPLLLIIFGLAAWNVFMAGPAQAQTLQDLLSPGATIDAGGLEFSNFQLLKQTALNGAPLPDPTQIMVTGQTTGTGSGLLYSFGSEPIHRLRGGGLRESRFPVRRLHPRWGERYREQLPGCQRDRHGRLLGVHHE